MNNVIEISRKLVEGRRFSLSVDATMGWGKDTLFLAGISEKTYAFEIQKEPILTVKRQIEDENIRNITIFPQCHSTLSQVIKEPVDFFIYNLGYLPKGNKELTTELSTTLKSVEQAMHILSDKGEIHIISYPGHPQGAVEERGLEEYLENLPQDKWNVFFTRHHNGVNAPPTLFVIYKKSR